MTISTLLLFLVFKTFIDRYFLMCDKQGNSYYVHYNIKKVSDQWAVGPMGCRTNGLSNQWAVGPQGNYLKIEYMYKCMYYKDICSSQIAHV